MDKLAPSVTKFTYKKRSGDGVGDPLLYKYNDEKMNTIERNPRLGSAFVLTPAQSLSHQLVEVSLHQLHKEKK